MQHANAPGMQGAGPRPRIVWAADGRAWPHSSPPCSLPASMAGMPVTSAVTTMLSTLACRTTGHVRQDGGTTRLLAPDLTPGR